MGILGMDLLGIDKFIVKGSERGIRGRRDILE